MFKTRFTPIAMMLVVLLVSLAVASPISTNSDLVDTSWPSRPDYSHPDEQPLISIPNTDYYQRHPELRPVVENAVDTTDYFFRHLESKSVDLTDYFFRHVGSK
jgi:hypothetical protein